MKHRSKVFRDTHLHNARVNDLLSFNRKCILLHYFTLQHFNLYLIIIDLDKQDHYKVELI